MRSVPRDEALTHSVLYLRITLLHNASPKAISGRTSYLRVRLEFLRYPHLIPTLFNGCGFGPPLPLTAASTWTWIDHPVSGLLLLTLALLRLGFPTAPHLKCLTLPVSVTRRTVLQKVRGRTYKVLPQLVDTGFQVLFHSPPGVLFTFPSRYWFTIGHKGVFSLSRWSSIIPSGFHVPRRTQVLSRITSRFRIRECHPLRRSFPEASPIMSCLLR